MLPLLCRLFQLLRVLELSYQFGVGLDEFEFQVVDLAFRGIWVLGVGVIERIIVFEKGHNEYFIIYIY
jgi:hypothetical protein